MVNLILKPPIQGFCYCIGEHEQAPNFSINNSQVTLAMQQVKSKCLLNTPALASFIQSLVWLKLNPN